MTPRSIALAALAAALWGLSFTASTIALRAFSPPQLTALRFLVAALPVFVLPRPTIGWPLLVAIGLTLFTGQFLLLFFALALGLPPGLASVTQQTQVFFSLVLAGVVLGDAPRRPSIIGLVIAFTGLGLVALSVGQRGPVAALGVALMAALSWAVGNILVKRAGPVQVLPLMAWASLVPPLPALAVASLGDAPGLPQAIARAPWESLAAVAYLGVAATTVAYGIWGSLLTRYPTSAVAPFTLLVPVVGVAAAAAILGERFGALRLIGMALIVAGVAISLINLPSPISNRQSSISNLQS